MLKIGVTGNIGSGKSQICRIFEILGVPVYYADDRAKYLMVNNIELVSSIKTLLGFSAYLENGQLNRSFISDKIFSDPALLEQLNQIVHPAVAVDFNCWTKDQNSDYVIKEAALLFESGSGRELDAIILVAAPEHLRVMRVMSRDGLTEEKVRLRMINQMPEEQKLELADYVINNDGEQALIPQVIELHHKFTQYKV